MNNICFGVMTNEGPGHIWRISSDMQNQETSAITCRWHYPVNMVYRHAVSNWCAIERARENRWENILKTNEKVLLLQ